jgi:four helix bundle protein
MLRTSELAVQFYRATRALKVPAGLKGQLGRAASSIALNLQEGYGRQTMADRVRFFQIALGSIRECQAIVRLEQERFTSEQVGLLDHLAASTYKLIRNSNPNS